MSVSGQSTGRCGGTIKHVCETCLITFTVNWYDVNNGGKAKNGHDIMDIQPLVERDGKYLTPYDVHREQYKEEHGTYGNDTYV